MEIEQEYNLTEKGLDTARRYVELWNNGWTLEEIAAVETEDNDVLEVLLILSLVTLTQEPLYP